MKTKAKRKRHSAAFKATVAMEAMLGVKTVAQIAREHSVHPVQVSQWKTVLRERMPELFESGSKPGEDSERLVADLHRKIGELTVDLDYLKKNLGNCVCEPAPGHGRGGRHGERARAVRPARDRSERAVPSMPARDAGEPSADASAG